MSEFIDLCFEFPVVVFTTLTLLSVSWWVVTAVLGLNEVDIDGDLDFDLEAGDGDVDVDGESSVVSRALVWLGVQSVPVAISMAFWSVLAWFVSLVVWSYVSAAFADGVGLVIRCFVGIVIILGAAVVGALPLRFLTAPFRVVYSYASQSRREMVGRTAEVMSGSLTSSAGRVEVRDKEGAGLLVSARTDDVSVAFVRGDIVLIVDWDGEEYVVVDASEVTSLGL